VLLIILNNKIIKIEFPIKGTSTLAEVRTYQTKRTSSVVKFAKILTLLVKVGKQIEECVTGIISILERKLIPSNPFFAFNPLIHLN